MARSQMTSRYTWGLVVCWDGLLILSFQLSQFHGRRSWLVCEMALIVAMVPFIYELLIEWHDN
jgi:hypothetical protein